MHQALGSLQSPFGSIMPPPMKYLSPLALLALSGVACSNVLGLDELEFERPDAGTPAANPLDSASGGQSGRGGEDFVLTTGSTEGDDGASSRPAFADSFPSIWPEGTLFAFEADAEEPYYFAYEPLAHRLTVSKIVSGDDVIAALPWAEDQTWTHLRVVPSDSGPILIGYDVGSGILERASNFTSSGSFSVERLAGNLHTVLIVVAHPEGDMLFGYDGATGFYRGVPATSTDEVTVRQGEIDPGWTHIAQLGGSSEASLMFYDESSGRYEVYRLPSATESDFARIEIEFSFDGEFLPKWVPVAPPSFDPSAMGADTMYFYDLEGGEFGTGTISSSSGLGGGLGQVAIDSSEARFLRRDLTWIQTTKVAGEGAVFSFDGRVLDATSLKYLVNESIIR